MSTGATLLSIQVGRAETRGNAASTSPIDRAWTSAIYKHPVAGPVVIHRDSVDGDEQGDRTVHGGPDKAICVYSADHYPAWQGEFGARMGPGGFGENFTIAGVTEHDVCIGDRWSVGRLVVEVTQPRQPCWKLARKWERNDFAEQVISLGRTGWYFRVVHPETVSAGDTCRLIARPNPEWTIDAANRVMHGRPIDRTASAALAAVPLLSESWKKTLGGRA